MRELGINEYKEIVLGVLTKIDAICREHGLNYMIMYGTLIGAVRHRGFIPWDDDIDIVMPRKDYNRLMHVIRENDYGLNFISIENNPDTIYPYGKVCDTKTSVKEKNFKPVKGYGAFVDVFPLDFMPDDPVERRRYCRQCRQLMIWITHSSRTGFEPGTSQKTRLMRAAAYHFGKLLNTQKLILALQKKITDCNERVGESSWLGVPWAIQAEKLFPAELLRERIELPFEGHLFYAPKEYDRILKGRYGDYMQLPPEEERVFLHSLNCVSRD